MAQVDREEEKGTDPHGSDLTDSEVVGPAEDSTVPALLQANMQLLMKNSGVKRVSLEEDSQPYLLNSKKCRPMKLAMYMHPTSYLVSGESLNAPGPNEVRHTPCCRPSGMHMHAKIGSSAPCTCSSGISCRAGSSCRPSSPP